mgnify:CR=1 FL=1
MSTGPTRTMRLILVIAGLLVAVQTALPGDEAPLNLDQQPAFDFGDDPAADPLFAPEMLGLTNGLAGYDPVAAVSAFAAAARNAFPPSYEVFLSCWGNPRYALLTKLGAAAATLSATSPLGLASAFRGAGAAANVVPGRTAGWAGEPAQARLNGLLYELSGALKYVSPLVLDLDGDGVLGASRGLWQPHPARLTGPYAAFDVDGDGFQDLTEWMTADDGLLVTSPNPSSGRDLVGTAGGWRDGFEHLAAGFDLDHNGRVEGPELAGLYVWRDANTNAVADAGEVLSAPSLGIRWLATTHSGYLSGYGYLDTDGLRTNALWDWWPNYALANRRAAGPTGMGLPMVGLEASAAIRNLLFGRVVDDTAPARTTGLSSPRHIPPERLAAAGIDLASFRLALLADGGNALIGYDNVTSTTGAGRARVICVRIDADGFATAEAKIPLPFEEVYQLACNPAGRLVLVLGDQGSKLAVVDLKTGTVAPPEGLELRALGLRASGVAGDPMVRYSGTGNFWFSAWQLNEQGAVVDERVWAITPWGFWGGLSLEALRNELGPLRCHFITGPTSGFFAVPGPGGTNEQLWSVSGTNRVLMDTADAFGGLHAIPAEGTGATPGLAAGAAAAHGAVAYTKRDGASYSVAFWRAGAGPVVLASGNTPWFYPFLTEGGGAVVAVRLDALNSQMDWDIWDTYWRREHDHIGNFLGVGKVSRGALAVHGADGIEILPVPDAPVPPPPPAWHYTLLNGSTLIDDCPICGRPTIPLPLQGTFQLRLLQENPLFATYALENITFDAGAPGGTQYKVRGQGLYQVGGEVGLFQHMFLEVWADDGRTNRLCYFTNTEPAVRRGWPLIQIALDQTNGTPVQEFHLDLRAAPVRELWFSTRHGLTPGVQPPFTNYVRAGDLLSAAGRVVKRNQELTQRLGLMPAPDPRDLGLDGVDVLPRGEIAFSIEEDVFSETLGPLHHGDVLSDRGRVVASYQDLIGVFSPMPPVVDPGLDALHVLDTGEIYFSIETDFFSQRLGKYIRRGDLLSSQGRVVKSREELLARFHPPPIPMDFGLDAIFVWPGGEVWFSLEEGFDDAVLGPIQHGDLLSDRGEVLYRNLDLLREFQPLEDLTDFGLDALYVVSDALAPTTVTARGTVLRPDPVTGDVLVRWETQARLYQLEKTTNVLGPWLPVGPITTEPEFTDPGVLTNTPRAFYRLRVW